MGVYRCIHWKCWTLRPKFCLWLKIIFFYPWIISKFFIKWFEVGSPFGLGAKQLVYQAQILFWFQGQEKSWEFPRDVMTKLAWNPSLEASTAGWVPILVTKHLRQKSAGRDILEKIPLNCCEISDVRRFGKFAPSGTEIFAALLTSFVSLYWSNSGGMASDR